jgi:nicotinate phosphoribosyltransferase
MGTFKPTGVNPELVLNVRRGLDTAGFDWVRIIVSGGFDVAKIKQFEDRNIPVDAYAVGSALLRGIYDFTADIALAEKKGEMVECHKVGRPYRSNPRLEKVV